MLVLWDEKWESYWMSDWMTGMFRQMHLETLGFF
jgi:hypothetical protein